jgi:phytanoyl-CoA hydroxylase
VLFWNSRTIHGSLPTRDATVSRKSLTAHYLAEEHSFGNIRGPIPARYAEHQGMSYRLNERQYSAREFARARAFRFLDAHPFVHRCLRGLQRLVRFRA